MHTKNKDEIDHTIGFPAIFFAVGRRLREEAKESTGTSVPQCTFIEFAVLHYVHERGTPSIGDIAKILFVSPPAMTLVVNGMVKNKLLTRTADPADHRTIRVRLTARGLRSLKEGERRKVTIIEKVFSILSKQEKKELMKLLEKIVATDFKKKGKEK